METCPCGLKATYDSCCGLLITGQKKADDPEQLMRSRYTAYEKRNEQYLLSTWHPNTRPQTLGLLDDNDDRRWVRLEIISSRVNHKKNTGFVHFKATSIYGQMAFILEEKSKFLCLHGRWFYSEGECQISQFKVGRITPCPCGSKQKFKRCCA